MIKETFKYEYDDLDLDYIEELKKYVNDNYKDIMDFFKLDSLSRPVKIKIWSDINDYRNYYNNLYTKYGLNKKIQDWEVLKSSKDEEFRIDSISYHIMKDIKGHNNDTLNYFFKGIIHEFVHTCHEEYSNGYSFPIWFKEGIATLLSHQFDNKSITFTSSLENIVNGKADYRNYYLLCKYILEEYGESYLFKLAGDKELVKDSTTRIYNEAVDYYKRII